MYAVVQATLSTEYYRYRSWDAACAKHLCEEGEVRSLKPEDNFGDVDHRGFPRVIIV